MNLQIVPDNSFPLGVERNSYFKNWSVKGIHSLAHTRTSANSNWLNVPSFYRITKSPHVTTLRTRIIHATEDWDTGLPKILHSSMWVKSVNPLLKCLYYHLLHQSQDSWLAEVYQQLAHTEQLLREQGAPSMIPQGDITEACVLTKTKSSKIIEFNPPEPVSPSLTVWIFKSGTIRELPFDPKEWRWRRQGIIKPGHFFDYSTKCGYHIIIKSQHRQLGFDKWMEDCGYSDQQRKSFFKKLWHSWLPRKIASMVWLTIAN